jgi:hypothetical protein
VLSLVIYGQDTPSTFNAKEAQIFETHTQQKLSFSEQELKLLPTSAGCQYLFCVFEKCLGKESETCTRLNTCQRLCGGKEYSRDKALKTMLGRREGGEKKNVEMVTEQ